MQALNKWLRANNKGQMRKRGWTKLKRKLKQELIYSKRLLQKIREGFKLR
jgi:hypothetical protein